MADSIYGTPTPVTGNDFDGSSHAWGMKYTVSADCSLTGGRVWIPAAGRPTTFKWQVWRVGDATKIAESDLNGAGHGTPSNAAWYDFDSALFATPGDVAQDDAETYRVCVAFQGGDGVYTDDGSETFPVGSGLAVSTTGSFTNGAGTDVMPGSDYLAYFFADIIVETAGTEHTKSVGGTITPTGSITRSVARSLAGSATPTGSLPKSLSRALSGSVTPSGAITRAIDRTLGGTVTLTGTIARAISRTLSGSISPASAVLKALSRLLGGSVTPAGSVSSAEAEPSVPTVWRAGPPQSKWHCGPPQSKWSAGRMPVEVFRATSTETIRSGRITADAAGAAVDPTGFTVTIACVPTDTAPAAASSAWKAASWDTNTGTTPTAWRAQAAIGPSGVQELAPGTWWLFVKVTASGETPIIPSGAFKVVP